MGHTSGPWEATKSGRDDGDWSITKHTWGGGSWGNDHYQVIAVAKTCGEVRANARLIAAAPDLLETLEMLCDGLAWNIENHPGIMNESDSEALAAARTIIKKARGA